MNLALLAERVVIAVCAAFFSNKALSAIFDDRIEKLGFSYANAVSNSELRTQVAALNEALAGEATRRKRFEAILRDFAGISQFWEGNAGKPIREQDYAEPIREAVRATPTSVRLMSIACYEHLGRDAEKALLADILMSRKGIQVETVTLCPEHGLDSLNQRLADLKGRHPEYRAEDVVKEIRATELYLAGLGSSRNGTQHASVKCWRTKSYPPFRVILLDEEAFISPYIAGIHGHESPMYRIVKEHQPTHQQQSLYGAFERMYEQIRDNAQIFLPPTDESLRREPS